MKTASEMNLKSVVFLVTDARVVCVHRPPSTKAGHHRRVTYTDIYCVLVSVFSADGSDAIRTNYYAIRTNNDLFWHWGRDKMAAILHTFSNWFTCMNIFIFWFKINWNLFPKVQLIRSHHRSNNDVLSVWHKAIIWTSVGWLYGQICHSASPSARVSYLGHWF